VCSVRQTLGNFAHLETREVKSSSGFAEVGLRKPRTRLRNALSAHYHIIGRVGAGSRDFDLILPRRGSCSECALGELADPTPSSQVASSQLLYFIYLYYLSRDLAERPAAQHGMVLVTLVPEGSSPDGESDEGSGPRSSGEKGGKKGHHWFPEV
jgi:hypothetical protein